MVDKCIVEIYCTLLAAIMFICCIQLFVKQVFWSCMYSIHVCLLVDRVTFEIDAAIERLSCNIKPICKPVVS